MRMARTTLYRATCGHGSPRSMVAAPAPGAMIYSRRHGAGPNRHTRVAAPVSILRSHRRHIIIEQSNSPRPAQNPAVSRITSDILIAVTAFPPFLAARMPARKKCHRIRSRHLLPACCGEFFREIGRTYLTIVTMVTTVTTVTSLTVCKSVDAARQTGSQLVRVEMLITDQLP